MKTIIFYAILILIAFLFISKTQVSMYPFKVEIKNLAYGVGWLMFMLGLIIMLTDRSATEYKRGFEKGQKMILDKIDKDYVIISKKNIEKIKIKDKDGNELK
jgi:small neutral amino acid transporter SnatA (MarC family)